MVCRTFSKKISEILFFGNLGGILYYGIEMGFRGFSHWSMYLIGGLVFVFCTEQGARMRWKEAMWIQTLRGVILTISLEFCTGIIFNKWLRKDIWDYSNQPYQLWGQICLPFSILFSGLIVIAIILGGILSFYLFKESKPHFFVL